MRRWQFFLAADRAADLSRVETARSWLQESVWRSEFERMGTWMLLSVLGGEPTPDDAATWSRNTHALRSVARRVKGFRCRAADIAPTEADDVLRAYIAMMTPRLPNGPGVIRAIEGVRLVPAPPPGYDFLRPHEAGFSVYASCIWQVLFGSLVDSFAEPVCEDCGRGLEPTSKGRISRAARCRPCTTRHWEASLPPDERRQRERDKKRKQREAKRTENQSAQNRNQQRRK